jgi:hypothetical protein
MQQAVRALPLSPDDPFETEERKRLSPPPAVVACVAAACGAALAAACQLAVPVQTS